MYGKESVFGENNGGSLYWSGGGDFARVGVTPYGTCTRGGNTDLTPAGMKYMGDSWSFVLGGFGTVGTIPKSAEYVIWLYFGGRLIQETTNE